MRTVEDKTLKLISHLIKLFDLLLALEVYVVACPVGAVKGPVSVPWVSGLYSSSVGADGRKHAASVTLTCTGDHSCTP